jgi:hypothetical protein
MIKFKTCKNLEEFNQAKADGKLESDDIVYITDNRIIWAQNQYFYCDANDRLGNYSIAVVKNNIPDEPAANTIYMVI